MSLPRKFTSKHSADAFGTFLKTYNLIRILLVSLKPFVDQAFFFLGNLLMFRLGYAVPNAPDQLEFLGSAQGSQI